MRGRLRRSCAQKSLRNSEEIATPSPHSMSHHGGATVAQRVRSQYRPLRNSPYSTRATASCRNRTNRSIIALKNSPVSSVHLTSDLVDVSEWLFGLSGSLPRPNFKSDASPSRHHVSRRARDCEESCRVFGKKLGTGWHSNARLVITTVLVPMDVTGAPSAPTQWIWVGGNSARRDDRLPIIGCMNLNN